MLPIDLSTPRLFLVPPTRADIAEITAACQDPQIQEWTTIPVPYTEADAAEFVADRVPQGWRNGSPTWAIREACSDDCEPKPLLGMISLERRGPDSPIAEIGYWMVPAGRGRGYMSEAVQAVLDFGFRQLHVESIVWRCEVHDGEPNWPSAKVAWRAGFTFEGRIRKSLLNKGRAVDSLVGTILPDDPREPQHAWFGPSERHPALGDSRDPEQLVRAFHRTYGLPIQTDTPNADRERVFMRMRLVAEEFSELVGATFGAQARATIEEAYRNAVAQDDHSRDTVEVADALGDLVYVIYGMALELGIPMRDVLAEIQASNLSKLGADGKPIYRPDGKVLKGPNYFRPDIRRVLGI
ncbi:MAG: GNAT family N-acetyltransferase [Ancrocorticia sp.]|jgi:RimJ/RimL family protein N-acetyltransferase/predicted HAD superfamily Cof-like phosphohydrolase|nr:GNAT family N-acetyltransferase [Ancrocorticia sp.]MCI1895443.1 GNAT family N-acetyltransferase [Ancrocorticia sp.]MCI1932116.1 GNAT family N-acetyltransferase [Ancrocorticia sp.]MCI1963476.1 GNAT family N-acetyltransferase [Ancrocorticia sp.]MCI2002330.1 GNAT family N-acetyltransferase [Ancrocorticia sp.]